MAPSKPSAFDALREFTTAKHIRDTEACGVIARDLRAAVAEHEALLAAARETMEARAALWATWAGPAAPGYAEAVRAANARFDAADSALRALIARAPR